MPSDQPPKTIFERLPLIWWLLIISTLCLIASAFAWWQIVYKNPERVFNAMLANNLSTDGFTRLTTSDENNVSVEERAQVQLGAQNIVRTLTALSQNDDTVVTEALNTPSENYVRYTQIKTATKDQSGNDLDFTKALNVWGKSSVGEQAQQDPFGQALFGVFPMANVPAKDRANIQEFIKQNTVFAVDYKNVEKKQVDGRLTYVYDAQLLPQTYIQMLKMFGESINMEERVSALDPADYADAAPTELKVSIDVLSRRLVGVEYPAAPGRKEVYAGYGVEKQVTMPKNTIPLEELQQRLTGQL